jgi:hypothetical protein
VSKVRLAHTLFCFLIQPPQHIAGCDSCIIKDYAKISVQSDANDAIIVNKDTIYDLGDQLLSCRQDISSILTFLPVLIEIAQQIGSFHQIVVVNWTQRFNLALKLLALLDIFIQAKGNPAPN